MSDPLKDAIDGIPDPCVVEARELEKLREENAQLKARLDTTTWGQVALAGTQY